MQNVLDLVEVVSVVNSSGHLWEHLVVSSANAEGTVLGTDVEWFWGHRV